MGTKRLISVMVVLLGLLNIAGICQAREDATASQPSTIQIQTGLGTTTLVGISDVPGNGTSIFYSLSGLYPPSPFFSSQFSGLPLYLGPPSSDGVNNIYVDDLDFNYASYWESFGTNGSGRTWARAMDSPPTPGDGGSGGTNSSGGDFAPYSFPTNGLYLQMLNLSDEVASLNICNATEYVYEVFSTTDLTLPLTNWNIECEVFPTNSSVMPFTAEELDRTNALYFFARDWTGITTGTNQTPQWWLYFYFGVPGLAMNDSDLDWSGKNTLLSDYQNSVNPNLIGFTLSVSNLYVNTLSSGL